MLPARTHRPGGSVPASPHRKASPSSVSPTSVSTCRERPLWRSAPNRNATEGVPYTKPCTFSSAQQLAFLVLGDFLEAFDHLGVFEHHDPLNRPEDEEQAGEREQPTDHDDDVLVGVFR